MAIFATFPVTPPRLGVLDVIDTVTDRSNTYRAIQPPGLTNQYAALPSLHFGWNLLLGIVMFREVRRTAAKIAWASMPVAMAAAAVLTGNHFIIDVIAGATVALASWFAAGYLRRRPLFAVPRFVPSGSPGRW